MQAYEQLTGHRTQLYLPVSLYKKVKEKIKQEEITLAEFIRRLIKKELEDTQRKNDNQVDRAWKKFLTAAGIGKGPKDLSYNHDKYGWP